MQIVHLPSQYQLHQAFEKVPVNHQALINERFRAISWADENGWPFNLERHMFLQTNLRMPSELRAIKKWPCGKIMYAEEEFDSAYFERRPASELAALKVWSKATSNGLSATDLKSASTAGSGHGSFRTVRSQSRPFASGHIISYSDFHHIEEQVQDLLFYFGRDDVSTSDFCKAVEIFVRLMAIHPFKDGNGRVARVFFQAYLHKSGHLKKPVAPIGAFVTRNKALFVNCLFKLYFDEDAVPLLYLLLEGMARLSIELEKLLAAGSLSESATACSRR